MSSCEEHLSDVKSYYDRSENCTIEYNEIGRRYINMRGNDGKIKYHNDPFINKKDIYDSFMCLTRHSREMPQDLVKHILDTPIDENVIVKYYHIDKHLNSYRELFNFIGHNGDPIYSDNEKIAGYPDSVWLFLEYNGTVLRCYYDR